MSTSPNIASYNGVQPRIGAGVYVHPSAQVIGEVSIGEVQKVINGFLGLPTSC